MEEVKEDKLQDEDRRSAAGDTDTDTCIRVLTESIG